MLPIVSKESGKAVFHATMSWTCVVEQGEVTGGDCVLIWGEDWSMGLMVLDRVEVVVL